MAYRNVVKGFRKVEPKVTVNLVEASDRDDLLARLSTSFAGGNPPDLFLLNYRFYGQFAREECSSRSKNAWTTPRPSSRRTSTNPRSRRSDSEERSCACRRTSRASSSTTTATCSPRPGARSRRPVDLGRVGREGRRAHQGHRRRRQDRCTASASSRLIRLAPFVWWNGGEIVDDPANPTRFTLQAGGAQRDGEVLRSPPNARCHARPRQRSSRRTTRHASRTAGSAMLLSSRRSTPTFRTINRLRLGRRTAAAARAAGGHPALGRVLHDEGLREQGRGLAVHRVRAGTRGAADHGKQSAGRCRR